MIRTITIGSYISIQGIVEDIRGAVADVRVGNRVYTGKLV